MTESLLTLHICNRASKLHNVVNLCTGGDGLLLMEDAVLSGWQSYASQLAQRNCKTYILQEDLLARGLTLENKSAALINYDEMPDLCLRYSKTLSW